MLTALGQEDDRIAGLEVGADDYVPKPFSPRELVLRVDSVLRRVSSMDNPVDSGCFTAGSFTVAPPPGAPRDGPNSP